MLNRTYTKILLVIITAFASAANANAQNFTDGVADVITLPVELTTFTGAKSGADVNLKWSTATEHSSSYFNVQRSTNGTEFTAIGKVNSVGNSSTPQYYNFTDANVPQGNLYYRLQQVDADGKSVYSSVVFIKSAVTKTAITVYPNPVRENILRLSLNNFSEGNYTVEIKNINGVKVYSKLHMVSGTAANIQLQMDSKPAAGIYIVIVAGREINLQQRIVVQ